MTTSSAQFDGPRLLHREELIDSDRLFHICFGDIEARSEQEILDTYVPPRRGGTYVFVFVQEGKPVSQIGIFHDQLKIYDGTVRTGSIGGVCTHPEYRNQGLATRLMERCTQQLVNEGASLMLISGDKRVYMRLGNVFQGKYSYFAIKPGQSNQWQPTPVDIQIRKATSEDALLCSQLYQAEPVHFVRQKSDFRRALEDRTRNTYICMDAWIIERAGQAVAYLFLGVPWGLQPSAGVRHVGEYAGSRPALVQAIHRIMATDNLQDVSWPVAWQDFELIQLLEISGYIGNITNLDGHTLRIINFAGVMQDLRPVLQARLDAKLLRGLRFEQSGPLLGGIGDDRYTIIRGSDRLELDGAAMTQLVMGNANTQEALPAPGALAEVISALFPLPSFLPGLNYH